MPDVRDEPHRHDTKRLGLSTYLISGLSLVFAAAAVFLIHQVNANEREQALLEAKTKAQLILDHNLAIHTYFSHQLKPTVFALSDPYRPASYFEPTWMSSTYAVREIDKQAKSLDHKEYYYKECAINARSPENEADPFEKAFIEELKRDPTLKFRSLIRNIDGAFYYVTLRRGEVLEESCLQCHSTPERAPQGLIDRYGPERSFNRKVGDVASAISIRVPLSSAYARADHFSKHLTATLLATFLAVFIIQFLIYRSLIFRPIKQLRDQTAKIIDNEEHLGAEVPLPASQELEDLAKTFNAMSQKIRHQMDRLEQKVEERTQQLQNANNQLQQALDEIKTLEGILPVCCYCKNIRDDSATERGKGPWMTMEEYLHRKTGAGVSHGCCPDCFEKHKDD